MAKTPIKDKAPKKPSQLNLGLSYHAKLAKAMMRAGVEDEAQLSIVTEEGFPAIILEQHRADNLGTILRIRLWQETEEGELECLYDSNANAKGALLLLLRFLRTLPTGWLGKTSGDVGLLNEAYIQSRQVLGKEFP